MPDTRPLTDPLGMQRLGYADTSASVVGRRIDGADEVEVAETLAEEVPVTVAFNGVAHAVMMATPDDLEDFALGFSITEGIVARREQITRLDVVRHARGIELQLEVPIDVAVAAGVRSRRLSGRTGCGLCGAASVEQVLRELPTVGPGARIAAASISRAVRSLVARQTLNAATGAVHAAAWARADGSVAHVREDVGRHNALDKLVGAMLRGDDDASEGFVVMTSRGSYELVQKVAVLGCTLLAVVSAPTALAVRVAHSTRVTLAGFARDSRVTVYTHAERVTR